MTIENGMAVARWVKAGAPEADEGLLRPLGPLLAATFLGFLTVSVPLPVLPLHVHGTLGFGTAVAGLSVGIQSFATILTRTYAGRMVDRRGAKATLVRGLAISAGAGLIYLASVSFALSPVASLLTLLAGRLVLGAGESLLITGVLSWAIIRAGIGRSGHAMSWNGMAQYGALAAGAPLGFALYQAHGFQAVAWAALLLPIVALAVVLSLQPAPAPGGARLPLLGVVGRIWNPGVALMLAGIGFASVSTFASLDFAAHGWGGAGFALLAYGLCFVAVRTVAGGLPDKLEGRIVAAQSMAVGTVGQGLLWFAPHPLVALIGAGLTGTGCSLVFPALGVEAVRRVPAESRGIALGAFSAFQDLAIGLTGPVLGALAAVSGPSSVFLIGAAAAAVGMAVSLTIGPGTPAQA